MNKQYGEFSRKGDEFIIYRPDTPKPWVHFLTNGLIISSISQSGEGSVTDLQSNQPHPLTREALPELLPHTPARRIFVRDNDSGQFWDLGGQVGGNETMHFEAVHSPSHTRIQNSNHEIDSGITFFLPPEDPCEIWQITVRNNSQRKRRLSLFAAIEWHAPGGHQFEVSQSDSMLVASQRTDQTYRRFSFFACDRVTDSFDTREDAFLGRAGSYANPLAVVDGRCSRSIGSSPRPIGVLQKNLTLGAGAQTEIAFLVGAIWGKGKSRTQVNAAAHSQIKRIVHKYRQPQAIESAFKQTKTDNDQETVKILVKTPDPFFDAMTNYWAKHEARTSALSAAAPSETSLANLLAVVDSDSSTVKNKLIKFFAHQSHDGRLIDPATSTDIGQSLVATTAAYIRETGDLSILSEHVDYADSSSATVLHHLIRCLDYWAAHLSRRHLPLLPQGISIEGKVEIEDQALACRVYQNCREFIPILDAVGEHELVRRYDRLASLLKNAINEHFWDGAWYGNQIIEGKKVTGFKKNEEHSNNLSSQTLAIISGIATSERAKKILTNIRTNLLTKYGLVSFRTPYQDRKDDDRSLDAAGSGTNGSIIPSENCQASTAAALIGDGDEAYRLWQLACPAYLATKAENYQAEPFRFAQFIYGPNHPLFGRGVAGPNSAASQMWQSAFQAMIGIQPTLGGLKIDPCLPRDWRQVEATRLFRGAEYHIRIVNSFRQNKGVDRILVDGVRITGTVIPPHASGVHFVEVVIG